MTRPLLVGAAAGLALGLLIGYQWGRAGRLLRAPEPVVPAPAAPAAPGGIPLEASEQIATARRVAEQDPRNRQAWVTLGNLYFDTHQPQRSIDAYSHALELGPDDPDVLTDQGVMYRAVGAFDRAVQNFQRASQLDPRHLQSLYNLGVVYAFDLKDRARAEEAWNRLIQTAPASENAAQARQALEQLRAGK